MRKFLCLLASLCLLTTTGLAQGYISGFVPDGGNPQGINTDGDASAVGWTTLITGPQNSNVWSPTVAIPFAFEFFGAPVTHLKASQNGLVTFDTATTVLPNDNDPLPSTLLPDSTIAGMWDAFTINSPTGTGDDIIYKTHGTAPNRQFWIKWFSFEIGNPSNLFSYFAVVLEEGTNAIYVVDQYSITSSSTRSVGVQLDPTTFVEETNSYVVPGNGTLLTDNDYWFFLPLSTGTDVAATAIIEPADGGCASSSYDAIVEVSNFSSNPITFSPANPLDVVLEVGGANAQAPVALTQTSGTLPPGGSVQLTLTTALDLTNPGLTTLKAYTILAGDVNTANDTTESTVTPVQVVSLPLSENFDAWSSPTGFGTGWVGSPLTGHRWQVNSGTTGSLNTGPSGDHTTGSGNYVYTETSSGGLGDQAILRTPCIDMSSAANGAALDYWYHMYGATTGRLDVVVLTDQGDTIVVDSIIGEQQTAETDPWIKRTVSLASFLTNTIQIAFVGTRGSSFSGDISIDDVFVYPLVPIDVGVTDIVQPIGGGCASSNSQATVEITNLGTTPLTFSPTNPLGVTMEFGGANPQPPIAILQQSGSLPPGGSVQIPISSTVNLSNGGITTITAYTTLNGDGIAINDTFNTSISTLPILSVPTAENFDSWSPLTTFGTGWESLPGSGYRWQVTSGNTTSGSTGPSEDHTTGSGNYVYTESSSGTAGDVDILRSPCIDLTTATSPVAMDYWYHFYGATIDRMDVQVWTDQGDTITVDSIIGEVQGNETDPWIKRTVNLSQFSTNTVQIAFVGTRGTSFTGDMAIDDFLIYELLPIDVGVSRVLEPTSKICADPAVPATVEVINFGTQVLDFSATPLTATIAFAGANAQPPVSETVNTGTLPPGDTLVVPFATTLNLSIGGFTTLSAYTTLSGDGSTINDTAAVVVETDGTPGLTGPLAPVDFTGYNFGNLPTITGNLWYEATGFPQPDSGFSSWFRDDFGNNLASPNGDAAKINLWLAAKREWIIGPKIQVQPSTALLYEIALTQFASTTPGTLGSDDEFQVLASADCGGSWQVLQTFDNTSNISATGQIESINLGAQFAGQEVIIGFYATEGTVNDPADNDLFLDNILIFEVPDNDLAVTSLQGPEDGCLISGQDTVRATVVNNGVLPIDFSADSAVLQLTISGPIPQVFDTVFNSGVSAPGDTFDLTFIADFSQGGGYELELLSILAPDSLALNDTAFEEVESGSYTAPYFEDFQTFPTFTPILPFTWEVQSTQGTFANYQWQGEDGATGSINTGPGVDHTLGVPGGIYLYTEASSGNTGDTTRLTSPCIDLSQAAPGLLEFWYHMYGADIGELRVYGRDDLGQELLLFEAIGEQDSAEAPLDPWNFAAISLDTFGTQTINLIFEAVRGGGFSGDIGIDDIGVRQAVNIDASMLARLSPRVGDCGDSTMMGEFEIENRGLDTMANVPVAVTVTGPNGTFVFNDTFPGPLALGQTGIHMFGPFNSYIGGDYVIEGIVQLPGDTIINNDTLRDTVAISKSAAPEYVAANLPYCEGDPVMLIATDDIRPGELHAWFDSTGGTALAVGDTFMTPPIGASDTFYLKRILGISSVGKVDNTGPGGQYSFFADGLIFDVLSQTSLFSVRVYPGGAGNITINLEDAAGVQLQTATFNFGGTVGDTVLVLNWPLNPGTGYEINATGSSVSGFFRNTSGGTYPYVSPGVLQITGTINGLGTLGYYYFFYDWQLEADPVWENDAFCANPPETIILEPTTPVPGFAVDSLGDLYVEVSSSATLADSVVFDFGDGTVVSGQTANHTYADTGTVTICQRVFNECGSDTLCQDVTLQCFPASGGFVVDSTGDLFLSVTDTSTKADSVVYLWGDGSGDAGPTHTYSDTGTYTVTQVAYHFCGNDTSTQEVTITCAFATAGLDFTLGPDGFTATFTASVQNADSIGWDMGDGTQFSGITDTTYTFPASGTYGVCLTVSNICGSVDTCVEVVITGVGIASIDGGSIALFPNPTQSKVTLNLSMLQSSELNVEMIDMSGRSVLREAFGRVSGSFSHRFDLDHLSEGIYLVKIQAGEQVITRKLQIE